MTINNGDFAAGAEKAIAKLRELKHKFDTESRDHSVEENLHYEKDSSKQFVEGLNLNLSDDDKGVLTGVVEYISFTMNTAPPDLNKWKPLSAMSEAEFKNEVENLTVR